MKTLHKFYNNKILASKLIIKYSMLLVQKSQLIRSTIKLYYVYENKHIIIQQLDIRIG